MEWGTLDSTREVGLIVLLLSVLVNNSGHRPNEIRHLLPPLSLTHQKIIYGLLHVVTGLICLMDLIEVVFDHFNVETAIVVAVDLNVVNIIVFVVAVVI